jgi:hypothetical protein
MAAFIISAPIWGLSLVPAAAPAVRAVVFNVLRFPSRKRTRPVARWQRSPDGCLVCLWRNDDDPDPPDY